MHGTPVSCNLLLGQKHFFRDPVCSKWLYLPMLLFHFILAILYTVKPFHIALFRLPCLCMLLYLYYKHLQTRGFIDYSTSRLWYWMWAEAFTAEGCPLAKDLVNSLSVNTHFSADVWADISSLYIMVSGVEFELWYQEMKTIYPWTLQEDLSTNKNVSNGAPMWK